MSAQQGQKPALAAAGFLPARDEAREVRPVLEEPFQSAREVRRVLKDFGLEHFDGDVTRANIQPRKRAQVLARYGGDAEATA